MKKGCVLARNAVGRALGVDGKSFKCGPVEALTGMQIMISDAVLRRIYFPFSSTFEIAFFEKQKES